MREVLTLVCPMCGVVWESAIVQGCVVQSGRCLACDEPLPIDPGLRSLLLSCRPGAGGDPDSELFDHPLEALFAEAEQALRQARLQRDRAVEMVGRARAQRALARAIRA
jgi:hypothetical protein